jgi:hypothetical protein
VLPEPGRFAGRAALAALVLALAWLGFHAWQAADFVLTPIGGRPPLAPLYAAFAAQLAPLPALAALGLLSAFALAGRRLARLRRVPGLLALVAFALAFRLAVHGVRTPELPGRELATYAGEEVLYDAARVSSARSFLASYAQLQPELSLHGRTKPPGFALAYHALGRALGGEPLVQAGALRRAGLLFTLLASLVVVPVYGLARAVALGEEQARSAAALAAVLPASVLYGAVTLDAVFATLAAGALVLTAREAAAPSRALRAGLGLLLCATSMLSYSAALLGLLCGLLLLLDPRRSPPARLGALAEVGAAFALPLLLLAALTGFDAWECFANARRLNAAAMAQITGRDLGSLSVWLYASLGNTLAPLLYLGPLLLAGLAALRLRALAPGLRSLALAGLASFGVACFGGLHLMETERILLYLLPVPAVLAAAAPGLPVAATFFALGLQAIASEALLATIW